VKESIQQEDFFKKPITKVTIYIKQIIQDMEGEIGHIQIGVASIPHCQQGTDNPDIIQKEHWA
jgi:hypothetical protein